MIQEGIDYGLADTPIRSCDERYLILDVTSYFQFSCSRRFRESLQRLPGLIPDMSFNYIPIDPCDSTYCRKFFR